MAYFFTEHPVYAMLSFFPWCVAGDVIKAIKCRKSRRAARRAPVTDIHYSRRRHLTVIDWSTIYSTLLVCFNLLNTALALKQRQRFHYSVVRNKPVELIQTAN